MHYVIQRLAQAVLTIFGALTIVFLVLRLTPGDPTAIMLGDYATPELVAALRAQYGLDRPLPVQYVIFLRNTVTGNFGLSLSQKTSVLAVIRGALPYTLELALAAMVVTCLIGIPLGMLAALRRNTSADFAAMAIALIGVATPGFLFALLLIYVFSFKLGWLPGRPVPRSSPCSGRITSAPRTRRGCPRASSCGCTPCAPRWCRSWRCWASSSGNSSAAPASPRSSSRGRGSGSCWSTRSSCGIIRSRRP